MVLNLVEVPQLLGILRINQIFRRTVVKSLFTLQIPSSRVFIIVGRLYCEFKQPNLLLS